MVWGAPAEAGNAAVEAPGSTVTDGGTVTTGLLEESATIEPLAGAGAEIVTLQVEVAPETTADGEHVTFNTLVAVIVSCAAADVPFSEAVSIPD